MESARLTASAAMRAVLVALAFILPQAPGQQAAPAAKNPPPKVGLSVELERMNQPPTAKFTNETKHELSIIYGPEKFLLKPGASTSVPIPAPKTFKLDVYEKAGKGNLRQRASLMASPNDPKRFIPLDLKKP